MQYYNLGISRQAQRIDWDKVNAMLADIDDGLVVMAVLWIEGMVATLKCAESIDEAVRGREVIVQVWTTPFLKRQDNEETSDE